MNFTLMKAYATTFFIVQSLGITSYSHAGPNTKGTIASSRILEDRHLARIVHQNESRIWKRSAEQSIGQVADLVSIRLKDHPILSDPKTISEFMTWISKSPSSYGDALPSERLNDKDWLLSARSAAEIILAEIESFQYDPAMYSKFVADEAGRTFLTAATITALLTTAVVPVSTGIIDVVEGVNLMKQMMSGGQFDHQYWQIALQVGRFSAQVGAFAVYLTAMKHLLPSIVSDSCIPSLTGALKSIESRGQTYANSQSEMVRSIKSKIAVIDAAIESANIQ